MGYVLKRRSWAEETRHSLYQARYEEGTSFLDEVSEQIGRRFFLLKRLWWAIEDQNAKRIAQCEAAYFVAVEDWNALYWRNRNKIRLLAGEDQASDFLDYKDNNSGDKPNSLHYKFVIAHRKVMAAKSDMRLSDDAKRQVTELNMKCLVFLERLTSTFIERAMALRLLEIPTGPGGTEQAGAMDAKSIRH
ncbi:hypothetical protein E3V36_05520 [Candidatus Marinimicrobia bacterium MT.SAG.2]|nr:hypothetical protein E3V36_05520 [Candidatus Marinimicrobia bacterium MT.SAG.2]